MKTKAVNSVDLMFRAIADPTRLRLLGLLRSGERCVCDLVEVLKVPQPKVSRHLAYLRRAGLVHVRKDRLWCYYRLAEPRSEFHAKLLDCLATCCENVPVLKRDARKPTTKCC